MMTVAFDAPPSADTQRPEKRVAFARRAQAAVAMSCRNLQALARFCYHLLTGPF